MKNCITINLTKEKIIMKINEESTQEEIVRVVREKILGLKKLYQNEKTPIKVVGKILTDEEVKEIKDIMKNELDVEINFECQKKLGLSVIKETFYKDVEISTTKFYRGSIRSGKRLEYEGSIVVMGDVNGGAEVIAGENIAVLGSLRGLAHAGARGNKNAIISATTIETPQIRIANIIKEIEKEDILLKKTYAYINNEEIILEP